MEKKVFGVCVFVGILGLLSVALGAAAELNMMKAYVARNGKCVYRGSPAAGLAIAAAVTLILDQVLVTSFTGCISCKNIRSSGTKFLVAVVFYLVSWITFVLSLCLFGWGALNIPHTQDVDSYGGCYVVKRGVFAGASVLSLVTVFLGIMYGLIASNAADGQEEQRLENHPPPVGAAAPIRPPPANDSNISPPGGSRPQGDTTDRPRPIATAAINPPAGFLGGDTTSGQRPRGGGIMQQPPLMNIRPPFMLGDTNQYPNAMVMRPSPMNIIPPPFVPVGVNPPGPPMPTMRFTVQLGGGPPMAPNSQLLPSNVSMIQAPPLMARPQPTREAPPMVRPQPTSNSSTNSAGTRSLENRSTSSDTAPAA